MGKDLIDDFLNVLPLIVVGHIGETNVVVIERLFDIEDNRLDVLFDIVRLQVNVVFVHESLHLIANVDGCKGIAGNIVILLVLDTLVEGSESKDVFDDKVLGPDDVSGLEDNLEVVGDKVPYQDSKAFFCDIVKVVSGKVILQEFRERGGDIIIGRLEFGKYSSVAKDGQDVRNDTVVNGHRIDLEEER